MSISVIGTSDFLNSVIEWKHYQSYLEIGTDKGDTFNAVNIENKECCDPNKLIDNLTYHMTSDEMFSQMPADKKYDIIFIDGLHHERFVDRDIVNSLRHLNPGGFIMCHDVLPWNADMATKTFSGVWFGDTYKAIIKASGYIGRQHMAIVAFVQFGLCIIKYFDGCDSLVAPEEELPDSIYPEYYNDAVECDYEFFDLEHLTPKFKDTFNIIEDFEEIQRFLEK